MFEKSAHQPARTKILVHFATTAGTPVEGEMQLPQGMSFASFMNADQPFIEVETGDGEHRLIARNSITEAREIMREPLQASDPYAVLRLQKGASLSEVKDAWKKRLRACHPDRIAALDLDQEIVYAAQRATQKINMAYDDIIAAMRARRKVAAVQPKRQPEPDTTGFSAYF
ncbi:MAG: J domain-containing protein [Aquisalinus sp.]|nr:J domain-containing protein [Aquisalinus sp.]